LQTIDRPTLRPPGRPRWSTGVAIALGLLAIPVLALTVLTTYGALLLVALVAVAGIFVWTWQRKILFYEMAAFLIHFDGIGFGPVRMGRIVAGFAVVIILYKLLVERWRPPAVPARSWVPIWLLLAWALLSGLWAENSGTFINMTLMFVLGLIYFGVTAMLVDSHEAVHKFLRAFWVGGLFGAGAGILGLVIGARSVGFGGDPNFFGLISAAMIPLTVYYRRHSKSTGEKVFYTVALLAVLAGEAGAGSRSGLIAAAVAIVATMVTRPGLSVGRRSRVTVVALIAGAAAFMVGFVANPQNLARGFADRGAGRLDFATVTMPLIKERPLTGHGFGQIRLIIPVNLRTTPGSKVLDERREDVSSHNTYLDTAGDLGLIGLGLFFSVFAVAVVGLVRPRWLQLKELSTTMFVMLLPVFSSSLFLPLLNNKMAWCLIGLAAAVQVPSWRSRWSGLAGGAEAPATTALVPAASARAATPDVRDGSWDGGSSATPGAAAAPEPEPERLAKWDLRLSRRAVRTVLLGAVLGAVLAGGVASRMPTKYSATLDVVARDVETSVSPEVVRMNYARLQGVLTLAISGAYAAELQRLSGVELSVPEIRERMSVSRPKSGNMVEIVFTDTDAATTRQVMPYLLQSLDNVFAAGRAAATEQVANELRPIVPGEQRYYSGAFYTPVERDPHFAEEPPRPVWLALVGGASGGVLALGFMFLPARRPRIESVDDFPTFTGLGVWSHIGVGGSRRLRATAAQFQQVLAAVVDSSGTSALPSRIVVTSSRGGPDPRRLATGVAAAIAAGGRRVVLVDAQLRHPRLSSSLVGARARGLADLVEGGVTVGDVMHEVPRRRFPVVVRRMLASGGDNLRFIPAGTRRARASATTDVAWFDMLDPEVAVVVIAPPVLGEEPVNELLEWSDAAVLTLVDGRTPTTDAEDAAGSVRLFAGGTAGIVLVAT